MADDLRGAGAATGSTVTAPAPAAPAPAPGPGRRARRRRRRDHSSLGRRCCGSGPALLLIGGVVIFPAVELVKASFSRYSITGLRLGDAGTANYRHVLDHPDLGTVLANTLVWVVVVVALTVADQPRRGAVPVQGLLRPQGRALGDHRAVGGVPGHHRQDCSR